MPLIAFAISAEANNLDRFSAGAIAADQVAKDKREDPGFLGDKSGTMEALYNVIDMGKEAGLFSKLELMALEKIANNVSNKLIKRIPENLDEQTTRLDIDEPGNPLYDLNNNDRDVAILNGLISKYGLNTVQLWITSGEYSRDYM